MAKFSPYIAKVNVPCKKCHNFVKAGVFERIHTCPHCQAKWS